MAATDESGGDLVLSPEEQAMVPLGASAAASAEQDQEPIICGAHDRNDATGGASAGAVAGIHQWQAFANAFKSFVGVGILALPYALAQSGLLAGVLSLLLIAFASSYTIKQVVRCKNELLIADRPADSYETVAGEILGRWGRIAAVAGIAASQLGFCISYVLFLVENVSLLLALHLPDVAPHLIARFATLLLLPFLIALSLIREMKSLSFSSALGIFIIFVGIVLVCGYGFSQMQLQSTYPALRIQSYYLFFGLAVFGFEGVNLAIPIESAMANRRAYPRVLDLCIASVSVLYVSFAVIGYLCFGDNTQAIISANLPVGALVTRLVAACLVIEVLVSYPVQLWPVLGLLEAQISPTHAHASILRTVVRVGSALLIVLTATTLPYFSLVSNLVGALANSTTMFILPPLLDMTLHRRSLSVSHWLINVCILVLGVIASLLSSALTMKDIVVALRKE